MTGEERRAALLARLAALPPERREALRALTLAGAATGRKAPVDGGEGGAGAQVPEVPGSAEAGRSWPLSFGQERLWFLNRFDPADTVYNTPWCVRLRGPVDAGALAEALTRVAGRHHVLRARFRLDGDRPVQVVAPAGPVPLEVAEVAGDPAPAVVELVNRPFDLESDPPLRAALLRLDDGTSLLCLVLHHIVVDGWSLDVLMRELAECYAARREGRGPVLEELPMQYTDFAVEDRRRDRTARLEYWTRTLAGVPVLDLPADLPRPARWTGRGGQEPLRVPGGTVARLEEVARRERCTLFMALVAAYQAALGLLAGQDDLCVGVPVAGRGRTELAPLIGYFSTTLVLRADLSGDPTFRELLGRTRVTLLRGLQHADAPFEQILGALRLPRDLSRPPLLQAMFNLHNMPKDDLLRTSMGDLEVEVYPVPAAGRTKAEVSVDLWRAGEGLGGVLDYGCDLFTAETARRFARAFTGLLERAGTGPDLRLSELGGADMDPARTGDPTPDPRRKGDERC
ncbi:condensation domain-containing protein [Planomonospora sphaerica]|uniref:condensation domain-containing protein n=1 Tax=Planomonospora sphaerica TaxID=161355 RepID=UPI00083AC9D9|nr:condensation domain-containing protein [Planomonospora sphaerica]